MLTVVIGLGSALIFGAADFLGGLTAKRLGAILATGLAAAVGIGVFAIIGLAVPGRWSLEAIAFGALSGVCGAAAIGLLYACLAIGPMSILSPLTALVSAVVPLIVAVGYGETIGLLGWIGLGVGLIAIVFVGFVPERGAVRPSARGIAMAIGSGIAIGAFLIVLDLAPHDSGVIPMLANRTTNAAIMLSIAAVLAIAAAVRRSRAAAAGLPIPPRRLTGASLRTGILLAIACGVIDAIANGGVLWGVRIGDLSVMAVLTALYPIGTIVLARVVLKERIAPIQYLGLVLAIGASALLALD